jgi:Lon-like ATP-dependent protease
VIRLSGYILEEKLEIADRYLSPHALRESGLRPEQVEVEEGALETLIKDYCREAGVRNLQQVCACVHASRACHRTRRLPEPSVARARGCSPLRS